jgi:glycosyltransferase involved in cell wall biosynthesis
MKPSILIIANGNSSHTVKWIKGLESNKQYQIILYSLSIVPIETYSECENVKVFSVKWSYGSTLVRIIQIISAYINLIKLIRKFDPVIVHSHYATSCGLLGYLANPKKFIMSIWGSDVYIFPKKSALHKLVLEKILNRANLILSTSKDMAKVASQYTKKEIKVISFGIDINHFKKIEINKEDKLITIGILKSLEAVYGIEDLVTAFAIIKEKYPELKFKLLIVGSGSQEKNLKQLCIDFKIFKETEFTGYIDQVLIPEYHNQLDIAVFPSRSESFGVSALEASACETAVIASNVGGFPEVVIDNKTGYLIEVKNVDQLVEKISYLIENSEVRIAMGKAGRKFVEEKYVLSSCLKQMNEVYTNFLK